MPRRSKVITILPAYIRGEVERRLFENGIKGDDGLAQWVRSQHYENLRRQSVALWPERGQHPAHAPPRLSAGSCGSRL
jgi:hypothetical protein